MTPHKHAKQMLEYAQDAADTDTPWERWECSTYGAADKFIDLHDHPSWRDTLVYRRKRIPLCTVEDRDVYPGDKLWHNKRKRFLTAKMVARNTEFLLTEEDGGVCVSYLSWEKPKETVKLYQWAFRVDAQWHTGGSFYADEKSFREMFKYHPEDALVKRLDYTMIEVDKDD